MQIILEFAPTDRSTCKQCRQKIFGGHPRAVIRYGTDHRGHTIKATMCKKCAIHRINYEITDLIKNKNALEAMRP